MKDTTTNNTTNTSKETTPEVNQDSAEKKDTPKDGGIGNIDTTPVSEKLKYKSGHGIMPEGGNVGYQRHE